MEKDSMVIYHCGVLTPQRRKIISAGRVDKVQVKYPYWLSPGKFMKISTFFSLENYYRLSLLEAVKSC